MRVRERKEANDVARTHCSLIGSTVRKEKGGGKQSRRAVPFNPTLKYVARCRKTQNGVERGGAAPTQKKEGKWRGSGCKRIGRKEIVWRNGTRDVIHTGTGIETGYICNLYYCNTIYHTVSTQGGDRQWVIALWKVA